MVDWLQHHHRNKHMHTHSTSEATVQPKRASIHHVFVSKHLPLTPLIHVWHHDGLCTPSVMDCPLLFDMFSSTAHRSTNVGIWVKMTSGVFPLCQTTHHASLRTGPRCFGRTGLGDQSQPRPLVHHAYIAIKYNVNGTVYQRSSGDLRRGLTGASFLPTSTNLWTNMPNSSAQHMRCARAVQ